MTRTTVLAGLALFAMVAPARAGCTGYWAPIAGRGTSTDYNSQVVTPLTVEDAWLRLGYEPPADAPPVPAGSPPVPTGFIELDMGSAGYDIVANQDIQEVPFGDETAFSAMYWNEGWITATFSGDPSDIATLRLDEVFVSPSFHGINGAEIWFVGAIAVPEPSGGLLLAAGIAGISLLGRRRRARPA